VLVSMYHRISKDPIANFHRYLTVLVAIIIFRHIIAAEVVIPAFERPIPASAGVRLIYIPNATFISISSRKNESVFLTSLGRLLRLKVS